MVMLGLRGSQRGGKISWKSGYGGENAVIFGLVKEREGLDDGAA